VHIETFASITFRPPTLHNLVAMRLIANSQRLNLDTVPAVVGDALGQKAMRVWVGSCVREILLTVGHTGLFTLCIDASSLRLLAASLGLSLVLKV
jgi:hypothetical protein